MRTKKRLGEMLVESGLMTQDQLIQALDDQRKSGLKLGQYLTRKGLVNENQIVDMICRQLKIGRYHPDKFPLDLKLATLVPKEFASKHRLVPLIKRGFLLTIAMVDPMDIQALDAVEVLTNTEVEPVICTEQEMNYLFGAVYGMHSQLDNVVSESAEAMEVETTPDQESEDLQVGNLMDMAEEAPVIRLVNSILAQAVRDRASDIHLSPERHFVQVRFRIDGKLVDVPAPPKSMFMPIVSRLKILGNMDIATSRIPQDGRFTINLDNREINIRASTLPTIYGENAVLRLHDMSSGVRDMEQLGLNPTAVETIKRLLDKPYGMILATGPTGSGKTSTLYSMLKVVNRPDENVITLEDPVESRIERVRQVQLNRKAGMTFASGLRSILRQDPDVIMVGEIRDAETAGIAVQAALTGHMVLSTVHTNDSAGAITRLMDMGIETFLVSSVLLCSIAQRLVRTTCSYCREPYAPDPAILARLGLENLTGARFARGRGCPQCNNSGFKGRMGIYEVLVISEEVQRMIAARIPAQEISATLLREGKMTSLRSEALRLAMQGVTTLEEAMSSVMS